MEKKSSQTETFEVSKEQVDAYKAQSVNFIKSTDSVMFTTTATKVKVDLPSLAPPLSCLVFNNVQYADILATGAVLAAILAYFGVVQGAALAAVAVAVGAAIPEYLDIDARDIYLDFFTSPFISLYIEVDYYYYYM